MDTAHRTPEQDQQLLEASYASLWHWRQRHDVTPAKLSVGYWQLSRIYALLRRPAEAALYGRWCRESASAADVPPFFRGYAEEALARAAALDGDATAASEHLREARRWAEQITNAAEKQALLDDLATIS